MELALLFAGERASYACWCKHFRCRRLKLGWINIAGGEIIKNLLILRRYG